MKTHASNLRPLWIAGLMAVVLTAPNIAMSQNRHHQGNGGGHERQQHTHGNTTRQRTHSSNWQHSHARTSHSTINNYRFRSSLGWLGNGPIRGHRYRDTDWRRFHPDWNGRYFFHGGLYFYDPDYYYPAVIDNEWQDIAAISGGVALLGALDNDDTLFFAGTAGALYSLYRYDRDRDSDNRVARLRAAYFSRPYFWRDGVRYDRMTLNRNGERYYRFVRHGY